MTSLHNIMVAVCVLASGAVSAETYEGVHPLTSGRARAEVALEAVAVAHTFDPCAEGASSGVTPVTVMSTDRAAVQREAVAAAHAPNQNIDAINGYFVLEPIRGFLSAQRSF